jgi:AcrR family transcriptional regulator
MARTYQLRARAERQDETRQRIVEAAIELHQTLGPDATTVTDIAERAGVGRVTVYRHFPDEAALFAACSGHWFAQHPFPDLDAWRAIADRGERLKRGLRDTYAWHRDADEMLATTLPARGETEVFAPYRAFWAEAAQVLAPGRGKLARAATALALSYATWRTLTKDQGLSDAQAVEVAARII